MILDDRPVEEDQLHARIDGLLPPRRASAVDAYLAANPEAQARFSQYAKERQGCVQPLLLRPEGQYQTGFGLRGFAKNGGAALLTTGTNRRRHKPW
jgi:anti-sigma factor RsiW